MPAPIRIYPGVTAVGTRLLVVGGFFSDLAAGTTTVYDTVAAYDTKGGTWSTLDPMPVPLPGPNVAGVGGKLYVLGAIGVRDTFVYDLAAHRWSSLSPVPVTRGHGVAAVGVWGTKILLAGGAQPGQSQNNLNTGVRVKDVLAYDTATDQWDRLPDLAPARGYAGGAVLGNTFWVIGGSSPIVRIDNVISLDLAGGDWVEAPTPPFTVSSAGTAVLGGRIYVMGGVVTGMGSIGPITLAFDPRASEAADIWRMVSGLHTPRFATGAATIDGRIYFPGGIALLKAPATFSPVPTLEVFIP
jgi:N-acetylneuraminic acid mutarotase